MLGNLRPDRPPGRVDRSRTLRRRGVQPRQPGEVYGAAPRTGAAPAERERLAGTMIAVGGSSRDSSGARARRRSGCGARACQTLPMAVSSIPAVATHRAAGQGWHGAVPPLDPPNCKRRVMKAGRAVWVKDRDGEAERAAWDAKALLRWLDAVGSGALAVHAAAPRSSRSLPTQSPSNSCSGRWPPPGAPFAMHIRLPAPASGSATPLNHDRCGRASRCRANRPTDWPANRGDTGETWRQRRARDAVRPGLIGRYFALRLGAVLECANDMGVQCTLWPPARRAPPISVYPLAWQRLSASSPRRPRRTGRSGRGR